MSVTEDDILNAALTLGIEARARIVDKLLESLHGPTPPDVEESWQREIEDRIAADERGELEHLSLDETLQRLQERLKRRRSG